MPRPLNTLTDPAPDAVVIGAGPAGSLTACLLARRGIGTLLVERDRFPRSKLCGGSLASPGLARLERLGLADLPALRCAPLVRRLDLHAGTRRVSLGIPAYRVVDRARFDHDLARIAADAGAVFLDGVQASVTPGPVVRLADAGGDTHELRPRLVIAADGIKGTSLKAHPAFAWRVRPRSRIGLGAITDSLPGPCDPDAVTMLYGRPGYAGIAPLTDGRALIAAAADPEQLGSTPGTPPLAALLAQLGLKPGALTNAHTQPGVPALTRRRTAFESDDHVLVAGDAAGYLEPFTGEGMTWALESAERVAHHAAAIVAGRSAPGAWHAEHTRARRRNRMLCTGVTALLRRPTLTRAAIATLTAAPAAASLAESAVRALQHTPRARPDRAGAA